MLKAHEQEVSRLNNLVSTLQSSASELETSLIVLQQKADEESHNGSRQLESLSGELAEVKKLNDELNSMLAEKMARLDELTEECSLLRETVERSRTSEQELTSQLEAMMEDKAKDLEKFNADLDLVRTEALEKQRQLDGMVQALSEKSTNISESQGEVESLNELISQLQTSLENKTEEIEALKLETVRRDHEFESVTQALSEKEANIAHCMKEIESLSEALSHLQDKDREIELLRSEAMEKDGQLEGMVQAVLEKDATIAGNVREIESLMETISQFRSSVLRKDEEIARLHNPITVSCEDLSGKGEEFSEMTASFASSSTPEPLARQQPDASQLSYEVFGTHLTECGDEIGAGEFELVKQQAEVSSSHCELPTADEESQDLSSLSEENRHLIVEREHMSVTEISEQKREDEEMKSMLSEKASRFEELQETAAKLKNTERHLAARKETDLQKFTVDLDLLKSQIAEKGQQLKGIIRVLSEQDTKIAGRLGEIGSLRESVSQLEISIVNRNDEVEKQKCTAEEHEMKVTGKDLDLKSLDQEIEGSDAMKTEFMKQLSVQEEASDEQAQAESSSVELRNELTEAKNHMADIEMELEKLRAAVVQGRDELTCKEDTCKELTRLLEESRALGLDKDQLLAEKMTRLEVLSQECELYRDSVDKLQKSEQQLTAMLEGKESDLVRSNADLDTAVAKLSEKEQQLEEIVQSLSEKDANVAQTVREVQSLSETVSHLQTSLQNKDQEIELLKSETLEKGQQLKGLMQSLSEKDAENQKEIESLTESVLKLQTLLQSKGEEIERQKFATEEHVMKIKEQESELTNCYHKLEEHNVIKNEFMSQLSVQEDVIRSTRDELTSKEETCKELTLLLEKSKALGIDKDQLLTEKMTRLEVLSQECEEIRDTVDKLQKSEQRLTAMLEGKENNLVRINADLDSAITKLSEKEQQLDEKDACVAQTVGEFQSLSDTVSSLQMSLQNKDKEIELLKSEELEKDQQLEGLIDLLSDKDASIAKDQKEIESLTESVSELQTSLRSKDEETEQQKLVIQQHEVKIKEQDSEIGNYCRKLEEHEVMKTELVSQLSEQHDVVKSLKDELARTTDDTVKDSQFLKSEISQKDGKISELTDTVASLNESVFGLGEQLAKSESSCEELRRELTEMKVCGEMKDAEMDSLQATISASRDELAKKEEEMFKYVTTLNESSDVLRQQIAESELACKQLRNELTESRAEIKTKEVELEKLRYDISAGSDALAQNSENFKELSELLEDSKGLVTEKEKLLEKYVQDIEELTKQNEEKASLLMEKTALFDELSRECYLLRDFVEKYKNTELQLTSQVEMLTESKANDLQHFTAEQQLLSNESLAKDQQLEDASRCIEMLKVEISSRDENILQLNESIASLNKSANAASEQLARSESLCEELKSELAKHLVEIEEKDAKLDHLDTELGRLQDSISSGHVEFAVKDKECKELSAELELVRIELIAARDQIEAKEVDMGKLRDDVSAKHADLTRNEEERRELMERVDIADESLSILRQRLAESESSCEELRTELGKYRDQTEAQEKNPVVQQQQILAGRDQSLEDSRDSQVEKEHLLEASSLEASDCLSHVESSEQYVHSDTETASHMYDVVECVRPRYVVSEKSLGDRDVAEAMQSWSHFCSLLTGISTDIQETTLLTQQCLAASCEQSLTDSCSVNPPSESDNSDNATTSLIPFATLTIVAKSIKTIRQHIETHDCKISAEFLQDVDTLHAQLSECSRTLEEKSQELEAARLEIETGTLRFEKLKAKSVAKVREVSQKHQAAMEQKEEEISELRQQLQDQQRQMVAMTEKSEAVILNMSDVEEQCIAARNRVEELETLLADKNAQIILMVEQMDKKDSEANVVSTSADSSVPVVVSQNLPQEDVERTSVIALSSPSHIVTRSAEDMKSGMTDTEADVLRQVLLNTGRILGNLLSVDDSSPSISAACEEDFSCVEQYAEQCREMVHNLELTSKLGETRLIAVTEELEEKKVLANKYAAAAKKLKQQLDQSKRDLSDTSDQLGQCKEQVVHLTSQLSALENQHSLKEAELRQLLKEKDEIENDGCTQITSLKEGNAALETDLLLKTNEMEELKVRMSLLEEQHSLKEAELKQLQQLTDAIKESHQESLIEIDNRSQAEIADLKEGIEALEAKLLLRTKEIEELKGEVNRRSEMEQHLGKLREDLQQLLKEKDRMEIDSRAEIACLKDGNAALEAKLLLRTKETEELKAHMSVLEDQHSLKEAELKQLQQTANDLKESQQESLVEIESRSQSDIASLKEGSVALEAKLLLRTKEIEELKDEIDRRSQTEQDLVKVNEDLHQLVKEKDERLGELSAESDADKAKLIDLEQTLDKQTSQLDSLFTANQELKNLLQFNDKETGELMESQVAMTQQLASELSTVQDRLDKKNSELSETINENERLRQHVDDKDAEIRQNNDSIVAFKQEIEGLRGELAMQSEMLQQNLDELASLSTAHETDVYSLEESHGQLSALRKELDEKQAVEMESHRKSCEMEAVLHSVSEELSCERLLSEQHRSECESLTAAVRDKDKELNRLHEQLRSTDNKVESYEMQVSELKQKLVEASATLEALEPVAAESEIYQHQLAELQTALEQKGEELAMLKTSSIEQTAKLDMTRSVPDKTVVNTEMVEVESAWSGDRNVNKAMTDDTVDTNDEMSFLSAQNAELAELNDQLSAEITTIRNRLADLEVENCTLRNSSLKTDDASSVEKNVGYEICQLGGDGLMTENSDSAACRLSELSATGVVCITERTQGNPIGPKLTASDELLSFKEKYSLLESNLARLKEELAAERQNSSRFMSIERLKESLEVENEKNLAEIESLTATKQKMLTKLKQMKSSNDGLVSQVDDLKRQLETKSTQESDISRMELEINRLAGSLRVLEDEKRNWLSIEENYKVTLNTMHDELTDSERKHEDTMKRLVDFQTSAYADKSRLEQQLTLVQDELRARIVDYESQLTSLRLEKGSLESSLEQVKKDSARQVEELKQKHVDLQMLHDALMSDNDSYQQLLEQLTSDNSRLDEVLRARTETVDELQDEIQRLRSELADAEYQREELNTKYRALEEQHSSRLDSDESALQDVEQLRHDLDVARRENSTLVEEIDGLNWKVQELSQMEGELTELQAEMFDVQSENGMLKKRLSFTEREASERSRTDEDWNQLAEDKQKLMAYVDRLEAQVNLLHVELDVKALSTEHKEAAVQCVEAGSESLENEFKMLRERYSLLEAENMRLKGPDEERDFKSHPHETRDQYLEASAERTKKSLEVELENVRQQYLLVEGENTRLKSIIEGMKSDNELLQQKVVACRTGSPRPKSAEATRRQQRTDQRTTVRSYKHRVTISFHSTTSTSMLIYSQWQCRRG